MKKYYKHIMQNVQAFAAPACQQDTTSLVRVAYSRLMMGIMHIAMG